MNNRIAPSQGQRLTAFMNEVNMAVETAVEDGVPADEVIDMLACALIVECRTKLGDDELARLADIIARGATAPLPKSVTGQAS